MPSAIETLNNIDDFLDSLVEVKPLTIKVGLSATISKPIGFTIKFNGQVIIQQTLSASLDTLHTFSIESAKENTLELTLEGKGDKHTVVNDQGEILSDTFVELTCLEIDKFNILADDDFIKNNSTYIPNQPFYKGFWYNSTFSLDIKTPFVDWYNQQTTLNIETTGDQKIQGLGRDKMDNLLTILDRIEK